MTRIASTNRDEARRSVGGRLASIRSSSWIDNSARPAGLDSLLDDFTDRWQRGESPRVEDYLDQIDPADPAVVELVYHEYCLAESSGFDPDPSEYCRRFPAQVDRLDRIFGLRSLVDFQSSQIASCDPAALPDPGDELGPYRLVRELGRGGFARVFLAEQKDLADRLVVLKVSTRPSAEPRLLATARHPHIVEVLLSAQTEGGGLHLLAMPFSGGATLSAIVAARPARPRSGRALLRALDHASAPEYPAAGSESPARELIAQLTYPKAVAWVIARLAEALDHAHRHGVAHGDIKPSNALLTAEGLPVLLDFNLAIDWRPLGPDSPLTETGGTLAYMPPERLRALAEPGSEPIPRAIDRRRADLYGLGLVLREVLAGESPEIPDRRGNPREFAAELARARARPFAIHPSNPAELNAILARCLAPDPLDRYASASMLAEDLDRYRQDLPLVFAPVKPGLTALARWTRRQRLALAAGLLVIASAGIAAQTFAVIQRGTLRERAIAKLELLWGGSEPDVYRLRSLNDWTTTHGLDRARSAQRFLGMYDVLGPSDWRLREDVRFLPQADRADLESWIWEQAWRYCHALEARANSPADWQRALACAERCVATGAPGAIRDQAESLRNRLGLPLADREAAPTKTGWMDDYLRGVAAEALQPRDALGHYRDALIAHPGAFWCRYRSATAAYRIGDYGQAADQLRICVDQRPQVAPLLAGLSSYYYYAKREVEAEAVSGAAIALDPEMPEAYRIRASIRARLREPEGVEEDIRKYRELARLQGRAPAGLLRLENSPSPTLQPYPRLSWGGFEDLAPRMSSTDADEADVRLEFSGTLYRQDRFAEALLEVDKVLDAIPDHLSALYRRVILLRRLNLPNSDRAYLDFVNHPRIEELIRREPVALKIFPAIAARFLQEGRLDEAELVAQRGLTLALGFGDKGAESYYILARIHARQGGERSKQQAIEFLRIALDKNPTFVSRIPQDPYLTDSDLKQALSIPSN